MARQTALPPTIPPRLVNREAAAAYVCVSPNTSDAMVKDGLMPRPKLLGGKRRAWDVRAHELMTFEHEGVIYVAGLGRFPDGWLAELFLNASKHCTALEVNAGNVAVSASLLLQHGRPIETRRALTRNVDGPASGPLACMRDLVVAAEASP
jgi:hypothetical protein